MLAILTDRTWRRKSYPGPVPGTSLSMLTARFPRVYLTLRPSPTTSVSKVDLSTSALAEPTQT